MNEFKDARTPQVEKVRKQPLTAFEISRHTQHEVKLHTRIRDGGSFVYFTSLECEDCELVLFVTQFWAWGDNGKPESFD